MVLWASIGTSCCAISVILINTGIFMRPLQAQFAWNRSEVSAALSIAALVLAIANPIIGGLIDRLGTRLVVASSFGLYGVATLLAPTIITKFGLPGLYASFALITFFGAGSTITGFIGLLSGWFSDDLLRSRGVALGCCSSGVVLGAAISGPLLITVNTHFGWEYGFYALALLPLGIGLPVSAMLIREAPLARTEAESGAALDGMTLREASRTSTFWLLLAIVLLISTTLQGLAIHVAPFLSDIGVGPEMLALVVMVNFLVAIPARLFSGFLFDRYFAPHVAIVVFIIPLIGAGLMATYPILGVAILGSFLLAIGQGAESDLIGFLVSRYFGVRHAGRIFGAVYGVFSIGIAAGPYLVGRAYDAYSSYRLSFLLALVGLFVLCILLALLPRYRQSHDGFAN
ncbi:MFS transporter [Novosphingobium aerophilum]|uniref:MFS transporter n=1 Tax=Novosphingobium aerophilum TaxID=2839843 RepID=A0A7X1FB29_9SPHN|nr:MFS transporter [Novosphingobium aerophilum]MBC2653469.1 MFS transporter [Novosphingobium aerophilum]